MYKTRFDSQRMILNVFLKSFFRIGMWHSRPPPPFMANTILNFHFDYLHPSLSSSIWKRTLLNDPLVQIILCRYTRPYQFTLNFASLLQLLQREGCKKFPPEYFSNNFLISNFWFLSVQSKKNYHQEGGIERQWNHSVDQEKHLETKGGSQVLIIQSAREGHPDASVGGVILLFS